MSTKNITSYARVGKTKIDTLIIAAIVSNDIAREAVQVAAIGVLHHAEKHRDYSKAQALVDGLGNSINKASLQVFFVKFGGLELEGKVFVGWKGTEYIADNYQNARATAWWAMRKAPDASIDYSLQDDLNKMKKRVMKALKNREDITNDKELSDAQRAIQLELIKINDTQLAMFNDTIVANEVVLEEVA